MMDIRLLLIGTAASTSGDTRVDPYNMSLVLMHDKAVEDGAVCLDGSPGGFYFRAATSSAHTNDWVLHFKGAGWCFDEMDCWGRSNMEFGSSTTWSNYTNGWSGGSLSPNDPSFGSFNKVILLYCDGASFTGDRSEPLVVTGLDGKPKPLYFRGRRIMDAIIDTLRRDYGLADAHNVLLTGCSSGGLAAYLHSDYLYGRFSELASNLKKFRVAPISGFFLYHDNVNGEPVYPDEIQETFRLSNSSGGLNPKCIASMSKGDEWKCMFAQNAFAHSTVPTFIENSALDAWQMWCIYCAEPVNGFPNQHSTMNGNCSSAPGYRHCSQNPENCTSTQITVMNRYIDDYLTALQAIPNFHAPGNGAFIHSCHEHCEGLAAGWNQYTIEGVSMGMAVRNWWNASVTDPAKAHTYLPCHYSQLSPHRCNPSCPLSTSAMDSSSGWRL